MESAKVGSLVTFQVAGLHGLHKAAGTVKLILPNGKLEVKAQAGGYYVLSASEITVVRQ